MALEKDGILDHAKTLKTDKVTSLAVISFKRKLDGLKFGNEVIERQYIYPISTFQADTS